MGGLRSDYKFEQVLSKLANKYSSDAFISEEILPPVIVNTRRVKVPDWAKDSLKVPTNTIRPRGGDPVQITRGKVTLNDVVLDEHSVKDIIDIRDMEDFSEAGLGDAKKDSTYTIVSQLKNAQEYEVATMLQDLNTYGADNKVTLSSSDQWTHADANIFEQIWDGKGVVRSKVLREANGATMSYSSLMSALKSPKLIAKLGANKDSFLTIEDLKKLFKLDYLLIGGGQYVDNNNVVQDYWSDNVILFHRPKTASKNEVAAGYTFRKQAGVKVYSYSSENGKLHTVEADDYKKSAVLQADAMYILHDTNA